MKHLGWTALAAGLLFVTGSQAARADDVVLLGGGDAPTQNLIYDGDADTVLAHYRGGDRGGYGYGGYRGYGYGGYRGYGYAGYRGYGYGGYRGYGYGGYGYGGYGFRYYSPSFAFSYGYRPYYNNFYYRPYSYYRPYYSPYYYSSYAYSYPSYSYPSYYYAYPCVLDEAGNGNAVVLGQQRPMEQKQVMPPAGNGDGTYFYDGGPANRVPIPGAEPKFPPKGPTVPLEGKLVSLPAKSATVAFPAFGEAPATAAPAQNDARFVSLQATTSSRSAFPAYGEK